MLSSWLHYMISRSMLCLPIRLMLSTMASSSISIPQMPHGVEVLIKPQACMATSLSITCHTSICSSAISITIVLRESHLANSFMSEAMATTGLWQRAIRLWLAPPRWLPWLLLKTACLWVASQDLVKRSRHKLPRLSLLPMLPFSFAKTSARQHSLHHLSPPMLRAKLPSRSLFLRVPPHGASLVWLTTSR